MTVIEKPKPTKASRGRSARNSTVMKAAVAEITVTAVVESTGRDVLVPLDRLFISDANVRKVHSEEGLVELAALIEAQGLLQRLSVVAQADGLDVSLNCKLDLRVASSRTTDRLHRSYALATFELQNGYIQATDGLQIAFGLLSRCRPILRLGRPVFLVESSALAGGNGFANSPRGDTPYAPTRCPQTRMNPGFGCVTGGRFGVTPRRALPMPGRA